MNENEKYLFDLNGYLVVKGALRADQVSALNEAIDHNRDKIHIRTREQALDGSLKEQGGRAAAGLKGTQGRGDFGGFLFWEEPWGNLSAISLPRPCHARHAGDYWAALPPWGNGGTDHDQRQRGLYFSRRRYAGTRAMGGVFTTVLKTGACATA